MLSPAARHLLKVQAKKQAEYNPANQPTSGNAYEITFAALVEDRRTLKNIQSTEQKIAAKVKMLPQYQPYIDGVLESGQGSQDDIITTLMLWHIDVGHLSRAIDLAEYVLAHNLKAPDQFKRSPAAILAEETALLVLSKEDLRPAWDKGLISNRNDHIELSALLEMLERVLDLIQGHDMHDQIQAQLYKAIGYVSCITGKLTDAHQYLGRALALNNKVGVKKDLERLTSLINKQPDTHEHTREQNTMATEAITTEST